MKSTMSAQNIYPLAMACIGEELCIVSFSSGKNLQQRLKDIGLTIGSRVRILKKDLGCPLLLAIGDTRIVLGHGMAHKIMACSDH